MERELREKEKSDGRVKRRATSTKDVMCTIALPPCLIKRLARQQSNNWRQMFGSESIAVVIVTVALVVAHIPSTLRASGREVTFSADRNINDSLSVLHPAGVGAARFKS